MFREIISLPVDNISLAGELYLPDKNGETSYPAVCICHGIPAARVPDSSDGGYPLLAEKICREGFAVLIFSFRGCGVSGGNLDLAGWARDLKAAINYLWLLPDVDKTHLSLFGFSGGAAVSVYVSSQDKRVSSVVACACPADFDFFATNANPRSVVEYFRSIGTIRDEDFPPSYEEWISGFSLISPIKYVAEIAPRPLLLVHGSEDGVVAVNHARRLYDSAGEPKQIVEIPGAGHRLRQDARAMAIVIDWLKAQAKH